MRTRPCIEDGTMVPPETGATVNSRATSQVRFDQPDRVFLAAPTVLRYRPETRCYPLAFQTDTYIPSMMFPYFLRVAQTVHPSQSV